MSIYIAIPCLGYDPELISTIKSCLNNAENPSEIVFGISMTGDYGYYQEVCSEFEGYNNIKIIYTDYMGNLSVGRGRNLALSQYNFEDYVLQIDSHSRMMPLWDKYLKDKFIKAKQLVNNKKVILTGYPARYFYTKDENKKIKEEYTHQYLGVNYWREKEFYRYGLIPIWGHDHPKHINPNLKNKVENTGFAPAAKICAAFMFSDSYFAYNNFLKDDNIFWEEEFVQSIEFINDGFSLIYPGTDPVISHLYTGDIQDGIGDRVNLFQIYSKLGIDPSTIDKKIVDSYLSYINDENNKDKVKIFEGYNHFSFNKVVHNLTTYPSDYINVGKNPL